MIRRLINLRTARLGIAIVALVAGPALRAQSVDATPPDAAAAKSGQQPGGDPLPPPELVSEPVASVFKLHAASSTEIQLKAWASRVGWTVLWNTPDDWIVPADHTFTTDFQEAAQAVLTALAENGADIRVDVYPDDHSVVVRQAGTE